MADFIKTSKYLIFNVLSLSCCRVVFDRISMKQEMIKGRAKTHPCREVKQRNGQSEKLNRGLAASPGE